MAHTDTANPHPAESPEGARGAGRESYRSASTLGAEPLSYPPRSALANNQSLPAGQGRFKGSRSRSRRRTRLQTVTALPRGPGTSVRLHAPLGGQQPWASAPPTWPPRTRNARMQAARSPRSPPPGPARAATARPSPPACPGRPSRLRGASAQLARRRQHAHGGPRAGTELHPPRGSPRQAAAPLRAGAPHGRAAAPPLSPAQYGGPSSMGEGREAGPGWASRAPSQSARPRRLRLRAGSRKFQAT